ncbi:ATP-binding protein [Cytophagaceae bacterium YF14B1]|uniref:histidine kinase n=1 Tax=Xanthocytophaga flava TaxID=3048013 RepID=A0AAE3QJV4_9BACT|nr:ATP-binding protein [Xanthocytophaga flavus]MDJ1480697.1 ATP-binding protein [Xanthocytophaga flavus]
MQSFNSFVRFLGQRSTLFYWLTISLACSTLLLTAFIIYSYRHSKNLYYDLTWVEHTYQVINTTDRLVQHINQCEGNVRGYALTHNKEFVRNFPQLVSTIHSETDKLLKLTADNPSRQIDARLLGNLIKQRLGVFDTSMAYVAGKFHYPSAQARIAHLEKARLIMQQIYQTQERIQRNEQALLTIRHNRAKNSIDRSQIIIILSALASIWVSIQIGIIVFKYIKNHQKLNRHLKELNEQKNRFFSIIAHDLRGPVHSVRMLIDMMTNEDRPLSEKEQQTFLKASKHTVDQTAHLLDNLLEWSRAAMQHTRFEPQKVNLYQITQQVLEWSTPLADQKQITLKNDTDSSVSLYADEAMIQLIVRNLVSNAMKFTLPGGTIRIYTIQKEHNISFAIADTGIGMTPDVMNKLFHLDSKHTTLGTQGEKGSGLGLLLTQQYVQQHKGTISVDSEVGKGSVFTISLPRVAA